MLTKHILSKYDCYPGEAGEDRTNGPGADRGAVRDVGRGEPVAKSRREFCLIVRRLSYVVYSIRRKT